MAIRHGLKKHPYYWKWKDMRQRCSRSGHRGYVNYGGRGIAVCERWRRLALAILLYTGLRRGDAARLGRQHVRDGVIMLRTQKTGTQVEIPICQRLPSLPR
jgi:integrase